MKKEVIFILIFLSISLASATIKVENARIDENYFYQENLKGTFHLSLKDVPIDTQITFNNQKISLRELLDKNNANYTCSTKKCALTFKPGTPTENLKIKLEKPSFIGFYLKGDLNLKSLDKFDIQSDFRESPKRPLEINFFHNYDWKFEEYSDKFSLEKWGCFNPKEKKTFEKIISAEYCEKIWIPKTKKLKIGAEITGKDTQQLSFTLYTISPEKTFSKIAEKKFNPSKEKEITLYKEKYFQEGYYAACVKADKKTNYSIAVEKKAPLCGFIKGYENKPSEKDHAIYLKTGKYANSLKLSQKSFDTEKINKAIKTYFEEEYKKNCTEGCIFPIELKGIRQNIEIKDVSLTYIDKSGGHELKEMSILQEQTPTITFKGTIDISPANFKVTKDGNYELKIGSTTISKGEIKLLSKMKIKTIYPQKIPAGIPTQIYLITEGIPFGEIKYFWKINEEIKTTPAPSIEITQKEMGDITLETAIISGNQTISQSTFFIKVTDPKEFIEEKLAKKENTLKELEARIQKAPPWYKEILKKNSKIDEYKLQIETIKKLKTKAEAEQDYSKVISLLQNTTLPDKMLFKRKIHQDPLEEESINPGVIAKYEKERISETQEYQKAIYEWETEQNQVSLVEDSYELTRGYNQTERILSKYTIQIKPWTKKEQYLVIKAKDLIFKNPQEKKLVGEYTIIKLPKKTTSLEFVTKEEFSPEIFISPKLSTLVINPPNEYCNNNKICDKALGENHKNCPSDCRSTTTLVILILFAIIIILTIYTIIQQWYKHNYEKHLFPVSQHLYNLLMFIENAKTRGMTEKQIKNELKKAGWDSERINYALKKSVGKTPGLPEIIPIEKIKAKLRKNKAQKGIITPPRQQFSRNFNKYSFQRGLR